MPRPTGRRPLSRAEVLLLVKQHLERAADHGVTKRELLASIGPDRTSLVTIQRALDDLRDTYDAQITCTGADRRWRSHARLAMPLVAPEPEDRFVALLAESMLEPHALAPMQERIERIVEGFDEGVRRTTAPSELPARKVVTSSVTLGSRIDGVQLGRLAAACRRKPVRILYVSPWKPAGTPAKWHAVEPWSLRMLDGAFYLRGWARGPRAPRTYRFADIQAVEEIEDRSEPASLRSPPADVWAEENKAFGIDLDRPGVAVIRFCGAIARLIAPIVWHPAEKDEWLEHGLVLQRTIPFRSCRELARRLITVIDGIESIEPAALREEVGLLGARAVAVCRRAPRRRATPRKSPSKSK